MTAIVGWVRSPIFKPMYTFYVIIDEPNAEKKVALLCGESASACKPVVDTHKVFISPEYLIFFVGENKLRPLEGLYLYTVTSEYFDRVFNCFKRGGLSSYSSDYI